VAVPNAEVEPAAFLAWQVDQLQQAFDTLLKPGLDYGFIEDKDGKRISDKPTLFKPGAEFLLKMFKVTPEFRIHDVSTIDLANGRVDLIIEARALDIEGRLLGTALASASSSETKWSRPMCPECGGGVWDNKSKKADPQTPDWIRNSPDFTCRDKCGWKGQNGGEMKKGFNPDQFNTIVKMTEKRAKVALALTVTAASHFFAQDIEDLPKAQSSDGAAPHAPRAQRAAASGPSDRSGGVKAPAEPAAPVRDGGPPPLPPLLLAESDRLDDGSFPPQCPYCLGNIREKEITIKKGTADEREATIVECTNDQCKAGELSRDKDFRWGWSLFGSLEHSYEAGGRVDELINAGGQTHEDIEATQPPWDPKVYLHDQLAICSEWSEAEIKEKITAAKRLIAHKKHWDRSVTQQVAIAILDEYHREFPNADSRPF